MILALNTNVKKFLKVESEDESEYESEPVNRSSYARGFGGFRNGEPGKNDKYGSV